MITVRRCGVPINTDNELQLGKRKMDILAHFIMMVDVIFNQRIRQPDCTQDEKAGEAYGLGQVFRHHRRQCRPKT